jgi:hypothetical protein
MFAATITLTLNAVAKVLNRVNQDSFGSEYRLVSGTEAITLKIRHSTDSVDGDGIIMARHNVFVEHIIYPTPTTALKKHTSTATIRVGTYSDPLVGGYLAAGLTDWLDTAGVITDLVAGIN